MKHRSIGIFFILVAALVAMPQASEQLLGLKNAAEERVRAELWNAFLGLPEEQLEVAEAHQPVCPNSGVAREKAFTAKNTLDVALLNTSLADSRRTPSARRRAELNRHSSSHRGHTPEILMAKAGAESDWPDHKLKAKDWQAVRALEEKRHADHLTREIASLIEVKKGKAPAALGGLIGQAAVISREAGRMLELPEINKDMVITLRKEEDRRSRPRKVRAETQRLLWNNTDTDKLDNDGAPQTRMPSPAIKSRMTYTASPCATTQTKNTPRAQAQPSARNLCSPFSDLFAS